MPSTEDAIFCNALEVPAAQREEFLQEACGGDRDLFASVSHLLKIHDTNDEFLSTPAAGLVDVELSEQPGDRAGCYELEKQIGEGGFGTVWQARQLEPIKRNVAVKIVKLGMDSERIVRRFDEERQTLAVMNHPNIATVLDAGTTDRGRPFVAMELVEGESIDEFLNTKNFSLSRRLEVFVAVCHAIQHAHQKGIVHRDLKPNNILVYSVGVEVIPKVIDFGIAKALLEKKTEITLESEAEPLVGTPRYMSPEQLRNERDIDTRSDIYSLGVILNHLVENAFVKRHRDLGMIFQKATRKDREQRYQTASELALDIERFQRCEPVVAGPPGRLYRFSKFIQRNKIGVGLASLALVATVLATTASIVGMVYSNAQRQMAEQERENANRQKIVAETEADEARIVATFLKQMISGANPLANNSSEYSLREHLDEVADSLDQLQDHPEVEAELRMTVARTYHNLSRISDAEVHYQRALELRILTLGATDRATLRSRIGYASCLSRQFRLDEAEAEIQEALKVSSEKAWPKIRLSGLRILQRIRGRQSRIEEAYALASECVQLSTHLYGKTNKETLDAMSFCADLATRSGRLEEAEAMSRDALATMMQHYPNRHFTIANSRFRLARTLVSRKKFAEAKRLANDVIQVQTKNLGKNDEHVIRGIALLANIHRLDGDPLAAESFAREAVSRAESGGNDVSGQDRLGIRALTLRRLAIVLQEHKVEEAVEVWKQAIMYRHLTWGDHPQVASSMLQRAKLLDKLDRFEESSSCCGEAVAMLERLGDSEKMLSAACLQYSEVLRKTGQGDLADDFLQKSLRLQAGDQ